ncbi:MAG: hypothetical protein PHD97_12575 [Bacteroidales bacterium]|nr:hypothetical protein [Bacteroidales bacterium]
MKKNLIYIVAFFAVICFFPGCKKGSGDPAVSFHSRKARLCGEWYVKEGRVSYEDPGVSEIDDYKDGKISINIISNNVPGIGEGDYGWEFTINRNGTYRIYQSVHVTYLQTFVRTETGYWYFLTKNNENKAKNKECVAFQPTTIEDNPSTYEYKSCNPSIFEIVKLKNNQIILWREHKYTENVGSASTTISLTYNLTLEPQKK